MSNDFYEDDEPIEHIREIVQGPPDGVTARPLRWVSRNGLISMSGNITGTPTVGGVPMIPIYAH